MDPTSLRGLLAELRLRETTSLRRFQILHLLIVAFQLAVAAGEEEFRVVREILAEALQPVVSDLAFRVVRRQNGSERDAEDFAAEAVSLLVMRRSESGPRLLGYNVVDCPPLRNWIRRVLRNCWRDLCRAANRRSAQSLDQILDVIDDRAEVDPESNRVPARLMEWLLRQGVDVCVELLILCWDGEQPCNWPELVERYRLRTGVRLPELFPWSDFQDVHSRQERIQRLANLIGCTQASLSRKFYR